MREPYDIPDLRRWLYAATGDLCEDASARIYEEVRAHFADAVEAGLDEGLTRDEAERAALEGLGPPYRAAKAFRRSYLTKYQDDLVTWMEAPWRRPGRLWVLASHTICMLLFRASFGRPGDFLIVVSITMTCWMLLIHCGLVPHLFRRGHPRRALLWAAFNVPVAYAVGLLVVCVHLPPGEVVAGDLPAMYAVLGVVLLLAIGLAAPIYRKLGADSCAPG